MTRLLAILFSAGALLLTLAVLSFLASEASDTAARQKTGAEIVRVRDAAVAEIERLAADARGKLSGADFTSPPPEPIRNWGSTKAGEPGASGVEFTRTAMVVAEPDRYAAVGYRSLRERIEALPDVGAPIAGAGSRGAYEQLVIVDEEGGPLFRIAAPPELTKERHRHRFAVEHEARGLEMIRKRVVFALDENGQPPAYKGTKSERILGAWGQVPSIPTVFVLVEITEHEALRDAGGAELAIAGQRIGRGHAWHGLLGGALLFLVAGGFLWILNRGGKIASLLRVYRFARPYKTGIVFVILLGLVFGAVNSMKIVLGQRLFDDVLVDPPPDAQAQLVGLAWATVALGLAMAVTGFFRDYLQNLYSTQMIADVRVALTAKLASLPMGYFQRKKLGDLVARLERDVAGLRTILNQVFETAFKDPFMLVGALVVAFVLNWKLALVLLGLPLVAYPLFRIAKKIKKRAETRQILLAEISHVNLQMLAGMKVVKAFTGEEREVARLEGTVGRYMAEVRKLQRLSALSKALLDVIQMIGGALLVWFGGRGVLAGGVSVGDLMAFMIVVQTCYQSTKEITSVANKFIEAVPATERVFEIFDAPDTIPDGADVMPRGPLRSGIVLRDVRFSYRKKEILKGIDLTIPAGKVVALVGPTGAGKTTICDLVARFYDADSGAVTFDGKDVRSFTKHSLMTNIAIVTQDAFLFNASIEENLRYGNPGATEAQIHAAARDSFVHDEILRMDGGYGKMAGERGTSLSGGQRQRVTIARALLKDAPVLILDEATSALDSHAEGEVQAALARLMAGRTVIVVAHRLSTIRSADHVVVLDHGEIVEQGPPSVLLSREGGRFQEMWDRQMGDERPRGPKEDQAETDDSTDPSSEDE